MKKLLSLILALALALALAGCGGATPSPTPSAVVSTPSAAPEATPEASAKPAAEKPAEDRSGAAITVPAEVNTIVSMAPSTTQVLVDLGLADKIVAIDTNSEAYAEGIPADALRFDMMQPDVEKLVALKPDIIFTSNISAAGGEDPFQPAINAGICVANIPTSNTVEDVKKDVLFIAQCVDKPEEGQVLVDGMDDAIAKIEEIGKAIPEDERKTVLFEIASAPDIYSFGSGVFLNELIEILGAKNVLADQRGWLAVTEESAVAANPDVILTNVNYIDDPVGEIKDRSGWENVTAVKNGDVYLIDNGASSLPNHHIADALEEMAKAIYPDLYK